ncbi:50S ribosomal protein L23 [Candidatus Berkelbacteria bacterium CG10_big_fil_rev_8_21_14_0_10_43_13]|uniref:Large ribosomal subunit protein uL23 n=1 Tax=Candidatus Berkelbacteria bacterium CG10_big_fil_rev_8_21_14_0_10_43_13 TaxID=1974514 RepID=A0A2H0W629_9BACT|nr:MAG: 50S ribosomal protein L23 [Candidatus Berkelbacteria bacterium CG10_big_fil_rev_8_21_14_0_10_43_13]
MNSSLIKSALISEKSFTAAGNSKFTFVVDKSATKAEVAETIAELFNVEVLDVNMVRVKGKVKRSRKGLGKRPDFKKAILTLKKGSKIDLFEVDKDEKNKKETRNKIQDTKNKENEKEKVSETKVTVRSKKEMPRKVI